MINKALISYLESDDDDDEIDDEDLELIQENTGIKIKKVCFFVMMMCVPHNHYSIILCKNNLDAKRKICLYDLLYLPFCI